MQRSARVQPLASRAQESPSVRCQRQERDGGDPEPVHPGHRGDRRVPGEQRFAVRLKVDAGLERKPRMERFRMYSQSRVRTGTDTFIRPFALCVVKMRSRCS